MQFVSADFYYSDDSSMLCPLQKHLHPNNSMNLEGIHTGVCKRSCSASMKDIAKYVASACILESGRPKKEHAIQALGMASMPLEFAQPYQKYVNRVGRG
jgi:hypothetical protein